LMKLKTACMRKRPFSPGVLVAIDERLGALSDAGN
jgi:hypothetical protein